MIYMTQLTGFWVILMCIFLKKFSVPHTTNHNLRPLFYTTVLNKCRGMTENELIEACIAQDRSAQHTLYKRYQAAMFTLAYRVTGDYETAAEALQDAFLQVFRRIEAFERRSTLGAWIKTIVTRMAINKLRQRKFLWDQIEIRLEAETVDWGTNLDAEYLEKIIQELPDGYRTVFVLAEIEGYSHLEIAEMLGINEGTSRSQLYYAKKKLRAALELI